MDDLASLVGQLAPRPRNSVPEHVAAALVNAGEGSRTCGTLLAFSTDSTHYRPDCTSRKHRKGITDAATTALRICRHADVIISLASDDVTLDGTTAVVALRTALDVEAEYNRLAEQLAALDWSVQHSHATTARTVHQVVSALNAFLHRRMPQQLAINLCLLLGGASASQLMDTTTQLLDAFRLDRRPDMATISSAILNALFLENIHVSIPKAGTSIHLDGVHLGMRDALAREFDTCGLLVELCSATTRAQPLLWLAKNLLVASFWGPGAAQLCFPTSQRVTPSSVSAALHLAIENVWKPMVAPLHAPHISTHAPDERLIGGVLTGFAQQIYDGMPEEYNAAATYLQHLRPALQQLARFERTVVALLLSDSVPIDVSSVVTAITSQLELVMERKCVFALISAAVRGPDMVELRSRSQVVSLPALLVDGLSSALPPGRDGKEANESCTVSLWAVHVVGIMQQLTARLLALATSDSIAAKRDVLAVIMQAMDQLIAMFCDYKTRTLQELPERMVESLIFHNGCMLLGSAILASNATLISCGSGDKLIASCSLRLTVLAEQLVQSGRHAAAQGMVQAAEVVCGSREQRLQTASLLTQYLTHGVDAELRLQANGDAPAAQQQGGSGVGSGLAHGLESEDQGSAESTSEEDASSDDDASLDHLPFGRLGSLATAFASMATSTAAKLQADARRRVHVLRPTRAAGSSTDEEGEGAGDSGGDRSVEADEGAGDAKLCTNGTKRGKGIHTDEEDEAAGITHSQEIILTEWFELVARQLSSLTRTLGSILPSHMHERALQAVANSALTFVCSVVSEAAAQARDPIIHDLFSPFPNDTPCRHAVRAAAWVEMLVEACRPWFGAQPVGSQQRAAYAVAMQYVTILRSPLTWADCLLRDAKATASWKVCISPGQVAQLLRMCFPPSFKRNKIIRKLKSR